MRQRLKFGCWLEKSTWSSFPQPSISNPSGPITDPKGLTLTRMHSIEYPQKRDFSPRSPPYRPEALLYLDGRGILRWEFPKIRGTVFWGPYNKHPAN